jgi:hypothetical protein
VDLFPKKLRPGGTGGKFGSTGNTTGGTYSFAGSDGTAFPSLIPKGFSSIKQFQ